MYRRNHLKVIKGEGVLAQHGIVVADCESNCAKRGNRLRVQNIQWWKLIDLGLKD